MEAEQKATKAFNSLKEATHRLKEATHQHWIEKKIQREILITSQSRSDEKVKKAEHLMASANHAKIVAISINLQAKQQSTSTIREERITLEHRYDAKLEREKLVDT